MSKRMLMIVQNFHPEIGSAANRMKNFHQILKESGYSVEVLTTIPSYPSATIYNSSFCFNEPFDEEGITRVKTMFRNYRRNNLTRLLFYFEITLKLYLKVIFTRKEYDLIFVSSPPSFLGLVGGLAKRKFKAKLVLDVRDLWPESLRGVGVFNHKITLRIGYSLENYIFSRTDKMIVNSERFSEYIIGRKRFKGEILFLPNALVQEEREIAVENNKVCKNITVIYTGNIGKAQNLEILIEVAERLVNEEKIKFKIIGYGSSLSHIQKLIEEKQLLNVSLSPPQNRKEVLKEISKADIAFLSLKNQEIFEMVLPGKLIDYMGMNKPIVANVSGYTKAIIEASGCGFVSEMNHQSELKNYILKLANDVRLRDEMGERGFRYAEHMFSWERNKERFLNFLNNGTVEKLEGSRKKVCMFVWNHFTNDARVLRSCSALEEAGYEIDLIAIHDKGLKKVEQERNYFTIFRVNRRFPRFFFTIFSILLGVTGIGLLFFFPIFAITILLLTFSLSLRIIKVFFVRAYIFVQMIYYGKKRKYDIYHANDLNTLFQAVVCSKIGGKKPLIYDSHEVQTSRTGYDSPIYGKLEKCLIRFADKVINENQTRAAYTLNLYGITPHAIHNYPFPLNLSEIKKIDLYEQLSICRKEPILLYQGGLQIGRGLDKIIEAIPLFKAGIVVFIGDGRIKADLQRKVKEMQLEERVRFVPKVPLRELPAYTANAFLGFQVLNNVCFNHFSASSNKLFEYMMSGIPVVACSFPEIRAVVEKEYTGLCIDSHEPTSIAQGVNFLLENPLEREKMIQNCLRARVNYSWDVEKKKFVKIYEALLMK